LESAAKAANRAVWEQARTNRGMLGMGTTLVALAVVEHGDGTNALAVAHIGDSRLYLLREGALRQVTVDHSLVQELVDDGQISQRRRPYILSAMSLLAPSASSRRSKWTSST